MDLTQILDAGDVLHERFQTFSYFAFLYRWLSGPSSTLGARAKSLHRIACQPGENP
jgi:hypothetical protein